MERKSSICLRVRQISAGPAVAPLSDVPKVVQSLYQLTNSIQKQHSPHLRPFVEGEIQFVGYTDEHDKLQGMLTLKKWKNVEIGLDQITGLNLAFFTGNTSSLTDLGQEYKWCPAGNIMGSCSKCSSVIGQLKSAPDTGPRMTPVIPSWNSLAVGGVATWSVAFPQ